MPFDADLTLIKEAVIIIICATTCLYCIILSKRLKGLTSAKSGMVASIVDLTQAIQQTHDAAKQIQASAEERINTLNTLLESAQHASIKLEAISTDAFQRHKSLSVLTQRAAEQVDTSIPKSIESARKAASALIKIAEKLQNYQNALDKELTKNNALMNTLTKPNIETLPESAIFSNAA